MVLKRERMIRRLLIMDLNILVNESTHDPDR